MSPLAIPLLYVTAPIPAPISIFRDLDNSMEVPRTPQLPHASTPEWRDLCRELGIKQTGRKEEVQARVLSHLKSDEGSCRDIKFGGSTLLRSLLQGLRLPMPGTRPVSTPSEPGVNCICGGHGAGCLVVCARCKTSQHRCCVNRACYMKEYECPLCQLRQMDPFEQVIDVVVPATLCQTQGAGFDPRPFIYTLDTHTKLMDSGGRRSLQLRCVRLDTEGYVQHWPKDTTIFVNNRPVFTASAQPPSSSRKRKDTPTVVKDFVPDSTNTVMVVKQREEDTYAFGLFLVDHLTVEEVYNRCFYEEVLTEDAGRSFVQQRIGGIDEVTTDAYRQPLKCPLTRVMPEVPARGSNCLHVQCFDLRAYIVLQEHTKTNKWRCPICLSLVLHITVDRYMLGILAEAMKVPGCEAAEFQPDGGYKLIVEERNEADEEVGEIRRKRKAEVVIEDVPEKKPKLSPYRKLQWVDFTTSTLDSSMLYTTLCYQSALATLTKEPVPPKMLAEALDRINNTSYGKSANAPIELDE